MDTKSIRYALPHYLVRKKGKWYVNVNAPNEISHLYTDGRKRVSSGTNDRRIANERASEIVDKIIS